ncbi:MAG: hypothetical protein ACLU80_14945 [Dorea sp.]
MRSFLEYEDKRSVAVLMSKGAEYVTQEYLSLFPALANQLLCRVERIES